MVRRISPIVITVMHDGLCDRVGNSQQLTNAPSVSLFSSGFPTSKQTAFYKR